VFDFFWNLQQHQRLVDLSNRESATQRQTERAAQGLDDQVARLERLTLACAALWSLLQEHGHTQEQLLQRMQELDLRDGRLDGRLVADKVDCTGCGRVAKGGRRTCLYCGSELSPAPPFGSG